MNEKWLYGPEKFPGLLRNGPLAFAFFSKTAMKETVEKDC